MNKENTNKLFDRFKFFRPELPMTENLMCFGFECMDGWFDLIWELCESIELLVEEDFNVIQVKEKMGGLRFYTNASSDEVDKFINKAEDKSYKTCEKCGEEGKVHTDGWIYTSCEKCKR